MTMINDVGQIAYEAYADSVDGLNVRGEVLPDWGDLGDTIREAWREAAQSAINANSIGCGRCAP